MTSELHLSDLPDVVPRCPGAGVATGDCCCSPARFRASRAPRTWGKRVRLGRSRARPGQAAEPLRVRSAATAGARGGMSSEIALGESLRELGGVATPPLQAPMSRHEVVKQAMERERDNLVHGKPAGISRATQDRSREAVHGRVAASSIRR